MDAPCLVMVTTIPQQVNAVEREATSGRAEATGKGRCHGKVLGVHEEDRLNTRAASRLMGHHTWSTERRQSQYPGGSGFEDGTGSKPADLGKEGWQGIQVKETEGRKPHHRDPGFVQQSRDSAISFLYCSPESQQREARRLAWAWTPGISLTLTWLSLGLSCSWLCLAGDQGVLYLPSPGTVSQRGSESLGEGSGMVAFIEWTQLESTGTG